MPTKMPPAPSGDRSAASRLRQVITGRFFWLLISLVIFIVLSGEVPTTLESRWKTAWPLIAILIAASYATRGHSMQLVINLTLNGALLICLILITLWPSRAITALGFSLALLTLFSILVCTLDYVFRAGYIGTDHVLGAVCAYVIAAMMFATIFTMQCLWDPQAFVGLAAEGTRPFRDLFYFSFTTLTTTGYGDITPRTPGARSLTMVEQLFGTFYMAVIFARLVGLYVSSPASRTNKENGKID